MIFLILLIGFMVGSFLNVCIFRIPAGRSVVTPSSFCPLCMAKIRFYDNIPVLSYFLLMGKCRRCGRKISFLYPFVEMLTGFFAYMLFYKFGFSIDALIYFVLISSLIVISFIDLEHYIIPDSISLSGIVLGFVLSLIPDNVLPNWISPINSFLGILVGGGSLLLIAVVYEKLTGREGIGGGDIKLLAMIGAFLGFKSIFLILLVSSILGSVIGIFLIMIIKGRGRSSIIPFGPFLSIGAIIAVFFGEEILNFYFTKLFYVQ